ncbi:TrkA-N domain protein [Ferroglobus placidus DSM 10642]|uniref:TrkA-N domain protein n=1 Tax=Ferroglobus placidus (strain DSM 10642 / AEDII12DO) TaxID=589924 RepID=D3RYY7_FERPA|nr:DHH family phosphoesterase [Ferroglobus placidus]ADC65700.1 TrkA-N domain protein [Ferroglobus placidus DSM 10642]
MESYDYIILGCGSFGSQVIMDLIQAGKKVIAVDKNPEKVEVLKDQEIEALIGDIEKDETLKKLNLKDADAVLVLTASDQTNLNVVKKIRSLAPEVLIVTRASSFKAREELEAAGADIVITPYDAMKTSLLNQLKRAENLRKLKKLKNVLKDCKRLAIFTHDNPDPDAISSAMALREIAKHFGVAADILYYGEIAHQQNRAMVNLLNVEMLKASEVDLSIYDKFALVDSSGVGVNNSIPEDITLSIIIDHHPAENVEAEYYDLRNDVGATATILTQYIQDLKIVPTRMLATALFFGIQTETEEFKKNTRTADFLAAAFLYPFVDNELIEKMEGPALSTETLDVIGTAIKNREIFSSFLISFAGFINDRDTLPQAADFLLKLEGISTVLVFGIMKDAVYISARNKDVRINIGEVLKKAFGDVGSAGGHAHAAGGKIPLGIFGDVTDKQTLAKLVTEAIKRRFLMAVGIEAE